MTLRLSPKSTAALSLLALSAFSLSACETLEQFITPGTKIEVRGERVSVLPTASAVEADPKLKNDPVVLPKPVVNADWPEPGGYADNVMHHLSAAGKLNREWGSSIGSGSSSDTRLTASPVVSGGKVYVLDAQVNVSAYDAKSGDRLWRVDLTPNDEDAEECVSDVTLPPSWASRLPFEESYM